MPLVVPPWRRRRLVGRVRGRAPARAFTYGGGADPPLWPGSPLGVRVMLAIGADPTADPATWSWTDFSTRVRYVDRITITRGRRDEQTRSSASTCRLTFLNTDGALSPRNVYGPYWGQLRRNTPLRVDVNPGTGWHTRFTGFVPEWSPTTDITGNFRVVPVNAQGVLRRLEQGDTPLKSPARRTILADGPTEYWPLEDGSSSETAGSAVGGPPFTVDSGTISFAAVTGPGGSGDLPSFSAGGALHVASLRTTSEAGWTVEFFFKSDPAATDHTPIRWEIAAGTYNRYRFVPSPSFGDVNVYAITPDGSLATPLTATVATNDSAFHHARISANQNGANIDYELWIDGVQVDTGTTTTVTNGRISAIELSPDLETAVMSVGHVAVYDSASIGSRVGVVDGYAGESAADRFDRLANEEGVPHDVASATATETMGPQAIASFLDLQRDAELADEGLIVERFDGRLGFDPHALRYNRDVTMTLDHNSRHVGDVPDITDDDLLTRNDVTVTRTGGSSGRAVEDSGPMGTDGSVGVGRYDEDKTISLFLDSQAVNHANWRMHLGTIDEQRFPEVKINLRRNPDLVDDWLRMDIGHRYQIINLPTLDLPPQPVDQLLEGYTEAIDPLMWEAWLVGSPSSGYEVFQIETGSANRSRIIAGTSTLDATYLSTDTSLSVTSTSVRWIDSGTYPSRFPITITIAGEVMTCTGITGTGLTQTFTVTRALYGTAKALPAGSTVQIFRPAAIAL